jgi:hypothetical protein
MVINGLPLGGPLQKIIVLILSLMLLLPAPGFAGIAETDPPKDAESLRPGNHGLDPLLPKGSPLLRVAICKGKAGSEFLECKLSGTTPSNIRTDYFRFVSAGWRLSQVVSDSESKLLIYFFEQRER